MTVMGAFSRSLIGEGGLENNRFASKIPNALTFFLNDGFIEKVRLLVRPPPWFHRIDSTSINKNKVPLQKAESNRVYF
jgi:hypothetical protein